MRTSTRTKTPTVADVEGFIDMLRAACDNQSINDTLEKLLSQPDERRRALVTNWVSELMLRGAPKDFARAIACLLDDGVAEKAYEVIFQCRRTSLLGRRLRRR